MPRLMFRICLLFLLGSAACKLGTIPYALKETATPDRIATGVAEARAIGATLTAEGPILPGSGYPSSGKIYFSTRDVLYLMNLDGSDVQIVTRGIGTVADLAIDMTRERST